MLDLARKLFASQNINSFLLDDDFSDLKSFDAGLRKKFFPSEDYERIKKWIFANCAAGNIYVLEDFFRLAYVVVPLSRESEKKQFFVASPFTFEKITDELLKTIAGDGSDIAPLLRFYRDVPPVFHRDKFASFLGALFPSVCGRELKMVYHYFEKGKSYLFSANDTEKKSLEYVKEVEARYKIEHTMHDAIRRADAQTAIDCFKRMEQSGIKPRAHSYVRNSQNFAIVLNSHMRKIMEDSGVHPYYVDEVSRDFAIEIEKCTSSVQVSALAIKMIKAYCARIASQKTAQYSETVQKSILYIDLHFTEYISLSVIAEELNLNPSYLSSQFTKETGENITAYINRIRIAHSLPLLAHKNMSIVDIAGECGFDDMNYFSRVFRKIMNCSPTEYRKRTI